MRDTASTIFGGRRTLDFTNAHPDFQKGLSSYEALIKERIAAKRAAVGRGGAAMRTKMHVARRGVDWLASAYPGLAPNLFGRREARVHVEWVRAHTTVGDDLRTVNGFRELLQHMSNLGLRDEQLGDPFGFIGGAQKAATVPILDLATQALLADIERHATQQMDLKVDTGGLEGLSEVHGGAIVSDLHFLLEYMERRNASLPIAPAPAPQRWPMSFEFIFSTTEPIASFLSDAPVYGRVKASDGKLGEKRRIARCSNLLHVYEFLQRREPPIGDPEFRTKLNKIFTPIAGRRRSFGGPRSEEIVALEEADVLRVLQALDSRVAWAQNRMQQQRADTNDDLARAYLAYFVVEWRIWTGIRNKGVASIDLGEIERLDNGTWVCNKVIRKARNAPQTKTWWLPQRAVKWLRLHLKVRGLALVEEDLTPAARARVEALRTTVMPKLERERAIREIMFGRPVQLRRGDRFARLKVSADRLIYPPFVSAEGNPLSPNALAEVVSRALKNADCAVTFPHILRHTMCNLYLNKYHRSPREIMTIADWLTEAMVVRLYPKREFSNVAHDFDRLTNQICQTTPVALGSTVVREALRAAIDFLTRCLTEDGQRQVSVAWDGLVTLMDTIAGIDPQMTPPSQLITMTRAQFDELDRTVFEATGRKLSLRKLMGGRPASGLPEPTLPVAAPSLQDAADEHAAA
jgi:integrase